VRTHLDRLLLLRRRRPRLLLQLQLVLLLLHRTLFRMLLRNLKVQQGTVPRIDLIDHLKLALPFLYSFS
jgi:hypothetical protein